MSLFEHDTLIDTQTTGAPNEAPELLATSVRALNARDAADMQRMLTALDRDSRCARFGWAASDTALATHVETATTNAAVVFGVYVDAQLRGVLEVYKSPSGIAEVAVVVAQEWRRRGLGWMMLQAAMRWADAGGAGAIVLLFSRHNWAMRQLTSKASARFDIVLDEISAEIASQPPVLQPIIQLTTCRERDSETDTADVPEVAVTLHGLRAEHRDRESA